MRTSAPGNRRGIVQPGAAPSQLETEVTRKVEDSVATVNGNGAFTPAFTLR